MLKKTITIVLVILGMAMIAALSHIPGLGSRGPLEKPLFDFWEPIFPNLKVIYEGRSIQNVEQYWEDSQHDGGRAAYTASPDARIEVLFSGDRIEWIGTKNKYNGIAEVVIDGEIIAIIDTYSAEPQFRKVIFDSGVMENGNHLLVIQATGQINDRSLSSNLIVDAIRVWDGESFETYQEGAASITYMNANRYSYIHFWNRKFAHIAQYFGFTLLVQFAFWAWKWRKQWLVPLIAIGLAFADEYHQTFINGRTGSLFDVGMDVIGIILALLLIGLMKVVRKRRNY